MPTHYAFRLLRLCSSLVCGIIVDFNLFSLIINAIDLQYGILLGHNSRCGIPVIRFNSDIVY